MTNAPSFGRALPLLAGSLCLWAPGCHHEKPRTSPEAVAKCEAGVSKALQAKTNDEATRIYYRECADVYFEPGCRQGFMRASTQADDVERRATAFNACRAAYCPIFGDSDLEACQANFEATPQQIVDAWPPLQNAMLKYDAKSYAEQIAGATLALYVRLVQPATPNPPAPSASH